MIDTSTAASRRIYSGSYEASRIALQRVHHTLQLLNLLPFRTISLVIARHELFNPI
jgi:hypothetical protein